MIHDIFISYSSKQKSIADGVCHYLEENGFKCWMAPRDILGGRKYGDCIYDAIIECEVFVLVFSEEASLSPWVNGEIHRAFSNSKPILPFRVDETQVKGDLDLMLNQFHWIDAFPHYADRLPDLLSSICGLLMRRPRKVNVAGCTTNSSEIVGENPKQTEKAINTISGHDYVDLGLPSGTLWATCNVGANKSQDYGGFFSWDNGNKVVSNWGEGWHMPTKEQLEELIQSVKSIWTTKNGVKGRLFSANNGNSLFFPAVGDQWDDEHRYFGSRGYYWSGSLRTGYPGNAWYFFFNSGVCDIFDYRMNLCFPIRLVHSSI